MGDYVDESGVGRCFTPDELLRVAERREEQKMGRLDRLIRQRSPKQPGDLNTNDDDVWLVNVLARCFDAMENAADALGECFMVEMYRKSNRIVPSCGEAIDASGQDDGPRCEACELQHLLYVMERR